MRKMIREMLAGKKEILCELNEKEKKDPGEHKNHINMKKTNIHAMIVRMYAMRAHKSLPVFLCLLNRYFSTETCENRHQTIIFA